jgi:DNA-binding NarL/FixJ family response regulator
MSTRLVIAHRSAFIRDVLRLTGRSRDVFVVGEARRPADLADLCASERPDVAFVEATFDDGSEVEAVLPAVLASGTRAVIVSDDPSPERVTRIMALGASGFLRHDTTPDQVVDAIQAVAGGAAVLGPQATATILEQWRRLRDSGAMAGGANGAGGPAQPASLTAREHDVLVAMADGLPAKAIARRLGVAVKTVENHKLRIFSKLGVRTQAQAVSLAITHGLLNPSAALAGAPSELN